MTTTIQNAYRWALDTEANHRAPLMLRIAARQLARALEDDRPEQEAEEAVRGLLVQWRRRESLWPAVEAVERIMGYSVAATA